MVRIWDNEDGSGGPHVIYIGADYPSRARVTVYMFDYGSDRALFWGTRPS